MTTRRGQRASDRLDQRLWATVGEGSGGLQGGTHPGTTVATQSSDERRSMQLARLKTQLRGLPERSPFYREKFRAARFDPSQIDQMIAKILSLSTR